MLPFMTDWTQFRYCPKCGSGEMAFSGKKLFCRACSLTYYINPGAAVAALIIDDQNRLLVATRANDPAQGTWDLPGGFADPGETLEDCLKREIHEELGVNITSCTYLASAPNYYPYKGITYHTVDSAFICKVDHPQNIKAADDISHAEFIPIANIDPEKFGMHSIRGIIINFLDTNHD